MSQKEVRYSKNVENGKIEFVSKGTICDVYFTDLSNNQSTVYENHDESYSIFSIRDCKYTNGLIAFTWYSNLGLEYILLSNEKGSWEPKFFYFLSEFSSTYSEAVTKFDYELIDVHTIYAFKQNAPAESHYYRFTKNGKRHKYDHSETKVYAPIKMK